MQHVRELLLSLSSILTGGQKTTIVDQLRVIKSTRADLSDAQPVADRAMADADAQVFSYDAPSIRLQAQESPLVVTLYLSKDERDVPLTDDVEELMPYLCEAHRQVCQNYISLQRDDFAFAEWQRYGLLAESNECAECRLLGSLEIHLKKTAVGEAFGRRLASDLPELGESLQGVRIWVWTSLDCFHARLDSDPFGVYREFSTFAGPCLLVVLEDANVAGSDYVVILDSSRSQDRTSARATIERIGGATDLQALTQARLGFLDEYPNETGYLPPEYWLSAEISTRAATGQPLPGWFTPLGPLFLHSLLATVSTSVSLGSERLQFVVEREFALSLDCSPTTGIPLTGAGDTVPRPLDSQTLSSLVNFYRTTLQGKFAAINHDLVQRAIVYGTGFDFSALFTHLDRVERFYQFEYEHLLGDRFEQQSRTLSSFVSDTMDLRKRLGSLVESLTSDLSNQVLTVLATAGIGVLTKLFGLGEWRSAVTYGLLAAPLFAYVYIRVYLSRIDSLRSLGVQATGEFLSNLRLTEQVWDFPLHTIGIAETDLDPERLLAPLQQQYTLNQRIAALSGVILHAALLVLSFVSGRLWIPLAKLIVDIVFLGLATRRNSAMRNHLNYFGTVAALSLVAALAAGTTLVVLALRYLLR